MSDVFEDRRDLDALRERLRDLIGVTPHLDWLLLTKRPELVPLLAPWGWNWPENVWLGTTVENQKYAELRLPHLTAIPAAVRFISAEPLLGRLDVSRWLDRLDWAITGGESGPGSRPSSPSWFHTLQDQCVAAGSAFHFKQWGDWAPGSAASASPTRMRQRAADGTLMVRAGKGAAGRMLDGATWDELPEART